MHSSHDHATCTSLASVRHHLRLLLLIERLLRRLSAFMEHVQEHYAMYSKYATLDLRQYT
jgi:hypothetical protein